MPIHTCPVCGPAHEIQPILHDLTYGHQQPTAREYIDSTFAVMHPPELDDKLPISADLVTTSASGLDPHIGPSGLVPDSNEQARAARH